MLQKMPTSHSNPKYCKINDEGFCFGGRPGSVFRTTSHSNYKTEEITHTHLEGADSEQRCSGLPLLFRWQLIRHNASRLIMFDTCSRKMPTFPEQLSPCTAVIELCQM